MSVKKKILSLTASLLLLTMLTLPAGAVSLDMTDPDTMLPVDIILDQDNKEIRKVYDLSPNTDPSTLPMGQFERDGLLYDCTDVLREVIIGSETQVITQEEKVDSDKKDMDTILSLLPQEKESPRKRGLPALSRWIWTASRPKRPGMAAAPSRSQPPGPTPILQTRTSTICRKASLRAAGP